MAKKKEKKISANINQIEPKQGSASIAKLPDVCKTPSSPEAGPIPIPYPNIAKSSDTASGAKKVKTNGKEVITKGASYKKSTGDEAPTKKTLERQSVEGLRAKVTRVMKKRPIWVVVSLVIFVLVIWVLLSNISITPKPVDLPSENIIQACI